MDMGRNLLTFNSMLNLCGLQAIDRQSDGPFLINCALAVTIVRVGHLLAVALQSLHALRCLPNA
jgi:hypothetical protein